MRQSSSWGPRAFAISSGGKFVTVAVKGRPRWALECLIKAGSKGCTPIDQPGPRWSAYVFVLRELGVAIEARHEPHGGPFKGNHARYVLQCKVTPLAGEVAA